MNTKNVVWHQSKITRKDRNQLNHHHSCVLWFTGLSGAGKSTIANEIDRELFKRKIRSYVLDGDNIRLRLNNDLGFSAEDRKENIRRVAEVTKLFVDAGLFVLTAFISPYHYDRDMARSLFTDDEFIEIYVKCSLEECERRDPKSTYKKARNGEINDMTGVSSPYEEPILPNIVIETEKQSIQDSVDQIIQYLEKNHFI